MTTSEAATTDSCLQQNVNSLWGKCPTPSKGWVWSVFGSLTKNFDRKRVPLKAQDRAAMQGPYPYFGASGVIDSVDGFPL